jgi:hypothetical protein
MGTDRNQFPNLLSSCANNAVQTSRQPAAASMRRILCLVVFLSALGLSLPVSAQQPELDKLASRLLERIGGAEPRKAVVVGLLGPSGATELGKTLGDEFAATLGSKVSALQVIPRDEIKQLLAQNQLSPTELVRPDMAGWVARNLAADITISGKIKQDEQNYVLTVTVQDVHKKQKLAVEEITFPRTETLEKLAAQALEDPEPGVLVGWPVGSTYPTCAHCRLPYITRAARDAKVFSAVPLRVLINAEGWADRAIVLDDPGYGLAERALDGIKMWRFNPAKNADGKPVACWITVEVDFALY